MIPPASAPSNPDYPSSISDCTIGFVRTDQWDPLASDDLRAIWDIAKDLLSKAGAQVEEVDLEAEFENLAGPDGRHQELMECEGRINITREYRIGKDQLDETLIKFAENKRGTTRQRFVKVQDEIAALRPKIDKIADKYSVLITPSVPGEAPEGLSWTGSHHFCSMWTALHVPTINVPGFAGSKGLPIGLTLVAPRYQDEKLLHVAKLVAGVFVGSAKGNLKRPPAPEGVVHLKSSEC